MTGVCAVTVTAPDAEWLAQFVQKLTKDRLCAGAHITTSIRSVYRWAGDVNDTPEAHVVLHTRTELLPQITARVTAEHPYEVPCVVSTPIIGGSPAYLAWIIEETEDA